MSEKGDRLAGRTSKNGKTLYIRDQISFSGLDLPPFPSFPRLPTREQHCANPFLWTQLSPALKHPLPGRERWGLLRLPDTCPSPGAGCPRQLEGTVPSPQVLSKEVKDRSKPNLVTEGRPEYLLGRGESGRPHIYILFPENPYFE